MALHQRETHHHDQYFQNLKSTMVTCNKRSSVRESGMDDMHMTTVHIVLKRYLHVALGKLFLRNHAIVLGLKYYVCVMDNAFNIISVSNTCQ